MRCADLDDIWLTLTGWLDTRRILVLPPLRATGSPVVRLDADSNIIADADADRVATPVELDRVLGRLRAVIEQFDVRAIYVYQEKYGSGREDQRLGIVTLYVVAGGVVHELRLFAASYAAYLSASIEADFYSIS